jgi:site-specific recombinase XerD
MGVVAVRDTRRRHGQGEAGDQGKFKPYRLEIQRAAPPEYVVAAFPNIDVPTLPAGTNFLVSSATNLPFEPFLEFLADRAFTRSPRQLRLHKSIRTVEAWTSDLRDFFAFLDAMKVTWQDVNEDVLLAYLDTMIEQPSPATGMAYADKTIIRRLSTIKSFYTWAHLNGRTRTSLAEVEEARELEARRINPKLQPKGMPKPPPLDSKVRPIPMGELRQIFDCIGPPLVQGGKIFDASRRDLNHAQVRNRMIAECGFQAGLRRAEPLALEVDNILQTRTSGRSLSSMAAVDVYGKGAKTRKVNFPVWLLLAIKEYISIIRPIYMDSKNDHGYVFVNHTNTKQSGLPLDPKQVNEFFRAACHAVGATEVDMRGKVMPAHTFHDLRHNFVLYTYFVRKAQGDAEPWIYIQSMLGHAFLETTIKTYMRLVKAMEADQTDPFFVELMKLVKKHA